MNEMPLILLSSLFLVTCQTTDKDVGCVNIIEQSRQSNLVEDESRMLDIGCQDVGDGTTLDWALCTRYKVDSLTLLLDSLYQNQIDELQMDINSSSKDLEEEDFLNSEFTYYTELIMAMEQSQKAFMKYVHADRELMGAFTGTGTARSGNENIRETELLLERIAYFERLEYN